MRLEHTDVPQGLSSGTALPNVGCVTRYDALQWGGTRLFKTGQFLFGEKKKCKNSGKIFSLINVRWTELGKMSRFTLSVWCGKQDHAFCSADRDSKYQHHARSHKTRPPSARHQRTGAGLIHPALSLPNQLHLVHWKDQRSQQDKIGTCFRLIGGG
ncbi:hypothetical protein AAMO2058_000760300 [Amorphochlora amoebiformis]